jgi:hypothetical protein
LPAICFSIIMHSTTNKTFVQGKHEVVWADCAVAVLAST